MDLQRGLTAIFLVVVSCAPPVHAQVFSPGELSQAHAAYEGLNNCAQCHEPGQRLASARCLACHAEVKARIDERGGLHGRLDKATSCSSCHREHKGRGAALIDWGPGGRDRFRHERAGFALEGAHAKARCKSCHERRRIVDGAVRKLAARGRETYLGLEARCASCHFDEHRGQLGERCERCHSQLTFSPAEGFDHDKMSELPLTGRHKKVECAGCHEQQRDTDTPASAFPAPSSSSYALFKGVEHESCADCHRDPHDGQMGQRCTRCHSTSGWRTLNEGAVDTGFHDKTKFPLRGGHVGVACKTCHGPFPGEQARFAGLPHARCDECHFDAHLGQLGEGSARPDCSTCHADKGFRPSLFDVERHARTRYPLEGGHRAVPCRRCHESDARLAKQVTAEQRRELARRDRELLVSALVLKLPHASARCESCHEDPHGGQFTAACRPGTESTSTARATTARCGQFAEKVSAEGCNACHQPASFRALTFDHDAMSRFPLEGEHEKARCSRCHATEGGGLVRFTPLESDCAGCHVDAHVGQLDDEAGAPRCARCHQPTAFRELKLTHDDEGFSSFRLEGRHRELECSRCHPAVEVASGLSPSWYRGVPRACAGCHEDAHRGRFTGFEPVAPGAEETLATGDKKSARCDACHELEAFWPARFAHERTGFPLEGRHAKADCRGCHESGDWAKQVPQGCASCHLDVHAQQFGLTCAGCHDEESWSPRFSPLAHRASRFPLTGRHAFLPCEECHGDRRDRSFSRAAVSCASCHQHDVARASLSLVDHRGSRFGSSCATCHQPTAFSPAAFAAHERCFPLSFGVHRGVRCAECHAGASRLVADGSCKTGSASCVECHQHRCEASDERHQGVAGYQCASPRCASCHAP